VEFPRGCVEMKKDVFEITVYSSCCNTDKGIYYYKTYENFSITAVDMHREDLDGNRLICYPMQK
jgi:choloylglycine hydrolase